jgi:hypothetical protein
LFNGNIDLVPVLPKTQHGTQSPFRSRRLSQVMKIIRHPYELLKQISFFRAPPGLHLAKDGRLPHEFRNSYTRPGGLLLDDKILLMVYVNIDSFFQFEGLSRPAWFLAHIFVCPDYTVA